LSDVLSGNAAHVEAVSGHVFSQTKTVGFDRLITRLGRAHMANARIEQSLSGLSRIFVFLGPDDRFEKDAEIREHLRSLGRDSASLIAHAQAVAASINFQLSAALGLINIEQSSIIKIFSVASVCFLPPTLIASIYGMNFERMPELSQAWGYPAAISAMIAAAVLPLLWFRKRGWL
jgi:magnesium transporter